MLKRELVDLINSGDVWLFVGAGASADAGLPAWPELLTRVVNRADAAKRPKIHDDWAFINALKNANYPKAFSVVEEVIGRPELEQSIATEFARTKYPGPLLQQIANWPVRGYVTTNYDDLIQTVLREIGKWSGWIDVGNSPGEVHKLGSNAKNIVWHVHGAINRNPADFHLVVTERDYEDRYLEGSPLSRQLVSLLTQSRVVFVGFGFKDPELLRLFKLVKRYSNPTRPAFAFLGAKDQELSQKERLEYLREYNVDVIPYFIKGDSHEQLTRILRVYSAFILKRTQKFGMPDKGCPSYDSETTALLVYNQIVLKKNSLITDKVLTALLKARILSLAAQKNVVRFEDLIADLAERVRLLKPHLPLQLEAGREDLIKEALVQLQAESLIESADGFRLTPRGHDLLNEQVASSERIYLQFRSHLEGRAREKYPSSDSDALAVTKAAESFLKDCVSKRALGVALLDAFGQSTQQFHIVALLQHLPEFMEQLNQDQALRLVDIVQDILANPSEEERKYIGVSLQAQFSLNLLGFSPVLVDARLQRLRETAFILDASDLLRVLARSCKGYDTAHLLLRRLREIGAPLLTTDLLIGEVSEHARWASSFVKTHGVISADTLAAVTGKAGYRGNLFLEGFLTELGKGGPAEFGDYMDDVCGHPQGHKATDEVIGHTLSKLRIAKMNLDDWEGFENEMWAERDEFQEEIATIRKGSKTFKHDRQTQAEAEVVIMIEKIRGGHFTKGKLLPAMAYFVSDTRVIDKVRHSQLPITIRPNAILQWLSTMTPATEAELSTLTTGILWELSANGFDVVDRRSLQLTFSSLTSAARAELPVQMERYKTLTALEYGEATDSAFRELDDLELPVAVDIYYAQRAKALEAELTRARQARDQAEKRAALSQKERQEYERLKSRRDQKRKKARGKARTKQKHKS